jgi:capsular polysaccharide biosynthesis protein
MQNERYTNKQGNERQVDLWHFFRALYKRAWLIVLATVMFAVGTFVVSSTLITPVYRSGFITYVNNKLEISNNGNTTVSDLNASYALAYTYESIITSRSVITEAVALCKENGTYPTGSHVNYTVSTAVEEKAPIISVYVEAPDADFARDLATAIAQVAPKHVERVVEGSSMRIVDEPIRPNSPSAPNNLQNALAGAVLGFLLACLAVIALEFYLDKVQSTEDLERRYDIPALGTIPDMDQAKRSSGRKVSVGR